MDYFDVIGKSYQISIKHKFLWIFGLLAGGGGIGIFKGYPTLFDLSQGDFSSTDKVSQVNWSDLGVEFFFAAAILILAIIIFMLIINYTSQGALISEFAEIEKGNKINFSKGLAHGWKRFWKILALNIILTLAIILSLAIIITPVVALIISKAYVFAAILAVLLFIAYIVFLIIFALVYPYSLRMAVLEDKNVFTTIRDSLHFVRDNIVHVFLIYLLAYVISIAFGLVIILGGGLTGIILFLIGYGLWIASPLAAVIYAMIAVLCFLTVLMIVGAVYNTFNFGIFTLTYLRLKKQ